MRYTIYQSVEEKTRLTNIYQLVVDFLRQVHSYREYLSQSVLRDLRNKYKRSVLGYVWTMLHPLCMMMIISIVFSHIMRVPIRDYSVFLFAGLLPWNYFHSTSVMSLVSIRSNARLFGQIPLPKYLFVLSLVFSNLVNLILAIIPLLIVMVALGRPIPITALAFPLVLLPLLFSVIGISLLLSASSVFFDDTLHLSEVALQALYFLSPILYFRESLPPQLVKYLVLNPLFCQIEFFRGIFYFGVLPDLWTFAINLSGSLLLLVSGLYVFRRVEHKFIYFV